MNRDLLICTTNPSRWTEYDQIQHVGHKLTELPIVNIQDEPGLLLLIYSVTYTQLTYLFTADFKL